MSYLEIIFLLFFSFRCAIAYQVEPVRSPLTMQGMGEGPHWDVEMQSLFYVFIPDNNNSYVVRYDYNQKKYYAATVGNESLITCIIPIAYEKDQYAICINKRIGKIRWDGYSPKATLIDVIFEVFERSLEYSENRFNDAKVDPFGRFYGGTRRPDACNFAPPTQNLNGSLYRFSASDGVTNLLCQSILLANGLAWNINRNKFYYIDSCKIDVKEYDYDSSTGDISNERVAIDFRKFYGNDPKFEPDGMTIDKYGNLFVAAYGSSRVFKVDPRTGIVLMEINFARDSITSAAFGGPNLDILYVTAGFYSENGPKKPTLFKVTGLGTQGLPGDKLRLAC